MKKPVFWMISLILAVNASAAVSQTVFELNVKASEQCSCQDIPPRSDGYSGWLTNLPLEESFRQFLRYKQNLLLGLAFIDDPIIWRYPATTYVASGRINNRATHILFNRALVFFENGPPKIILEAELGKMSHTQEDLMQIAKFHQATAIAYEEWTLNLHWELIHLGWHGTGTRKITILVHDASKDETIKAQPYAQGALCESYGIKIRLDRFEILS